MKLKKRMLSVVIVLGLFFGTIGVSYWTQEEGTIDVFDDTKSLYIWYTDDALTDYLASMALRYTNEYGVRVVPYLQSGLEYIENIYDTSLNTVVYPDLFIVSNDSIEKAYLSGLAVEVKDVNEIVTDKNFSQSALDAVTYHGKYYGYPYYFETSVLLYNKTYLEEITRKKIQTELEHQIGEEAQQMAEENTPLVDEEIEVETIGYSEEEMTELIAQRMPTLIPKTFDELYTFADEFDAPEQVEGIFKWDVEDIFFNYFFVGNYISVGGEAGDKKEEISIYNEDAVVALQTYQDLSSFFSIEADEVAYDTVIQEFMDGKLVFTTATSEIIRKLEEAKENGEFKYEYGVAMIPDVTQDLHTRNLSVTNAILINGYSQMQESANDFARFLVEENANSLYEKTGKIAANKNVAYENKGIDTFLGEYACSISMPKMMVTSNFWVNMEITFTKIWKGNNVSDELKKLSEQIISQVNGIEE
ncbi:MAG: sugar ABC transporter substrate-binding protein [Lachnospiraceae bacterium]